MGEIDAPELRHLISVVATRRQDHAEGACPLRAQGSGPAGHWD